MKSLSGRLRVILIGLIIFCYAEVWGADWKLIFIEKRTAPRGQSDTYYYIDMKSIKKVSSEKVRFWYLMKSVPRGSDEPSIENVRKEGWSDYIELDCLRERQRSVKTEREAKEGYVLIGPIDWHSIEIDSAEEKMAEVVCRRK
jgi:hypothetical protein